MLFLHEKIILNPLLTYIRHHDIFVSRSRTYDINKPDIPDEMKGDFKMEKYVINYHTGITEEIEANDLSEAKEIAQRGMSYTQENVTIETLDGDVLSVSRWVGVEPDEDDEFVAVFGDYGFYNSWIDELGK